MRRRLVLSVASSLLGLGTIQAQAPLTAIDNPSLFPMRDGPGRASISSPGFATIQVEKEKEPEFKAPLPKSTNPAPKPAPKAVAPSSPPPPAPMAVQPVPIAQPLPPLTLYTPVPDVSPLPPREPEPYAPMIWASANYQLWFLKGAPNPVSLVTRGDPNDLPQGAIGQPGTQVVFGGEPIEFPSTSGLQGSLGGWFYEDRTLGWEISGFVFENHSRDFSFRDDPAGATVLAVPFRDAILGAENAQVVGNPQLGITGRIDVANELEFFGAEANFLHNLTTRRNWSFDVIAGFRYVQLDETLDILTRTMSADPVIPFDIATQDAFRTINEFYGGQVGGAWHWSYCRWHIDVTGKVALGATRQTVRVDGSTTSTIFDATTTTAGGLFSQPTNIGEQTSSQFTVIPQVGFKMGYDVFPWLRCNAGYDFLYWNRVVRPGDQIDRNINTTQFAGNPLAGVASPERRFTRSDFTAHGVSFGMEFKY